MCPRKKIMFISRTGTRAYANEYEDDTKNYYIVISIRRLFRSSQFCAHIDARALTKCRVW